MNASDVLNRLTKHRRSQGPLVGHLLREREPLGQRVHHCGSWLHLREWIESGESRLMNANFCKAFLLCRSCAARRAGRLVESYAGKVAAVQLERPELIPAMLTLTVVNGEDLTERLDHLKGCWSAMIATRRKGKSKSCRHRGNEFSKIEGGLRSLEVTNEGKGWHPHLHVFCLLSDYIDHEKLKEQWHEVSNDSFVVGITKCKNGVVAGLIETVKYASKLSELDPQQALQVHDALKGNRPTDSIGCLRGVKEPDIDSDDAEGLTGPFRDFIANWLFGEQRYALAPIMDQFIIERAGGRAA